jgi:hypothetical protein
MLHSCGPSVAVNDVSAICREIMGQRHGWPFGRGTTNVSGLCDTAKASVLTTVAVSVLFDGST